MRPSPFPWKLVPPLLALMACGGSGGGADSRPQAPPKTAPSPPEAPKPDAGTLPETPSPKAEEDAPSIEPWAALPTTPPETTPDGIPVINVSVEEGMRWDIAPAWDTLIYGKRQATDGVSTFIAVREEEGVFTDVVIRGGEVRTNALRRMIPADTHPGGCGAVHEGTLLMSAPVPNEEAGGGSTIQAVWVMKPDGTIVRHDLPAEAGNSAECKAVVDEAGRFSLFAETLVDYDGKGLSLDEAWRAGRTELTRPLGPKYCFRACNEQETAGTEPTLLTKLREALGDCIPRITVHGDLVGARCQREGTAARIHVPSGKVETMSGVSKGASGIGFDALYFTREGHLVIEQKVLMHSYVVWPAGTNELSPQRHLELGEIMAQTSPTLLVRGLPEPVPRSSVSPIALGKPLPPYDPGDVDPSDFVSRRGPGARDAQRQRAAAVLPEGDIVLTDSVAVSLKCGAYVNAPIGYEHEPFVHDFDPPTMLPLSPKAVHQPPTCLPLTEVHAVPRMSDMLLAKTADGRLAVARLSNYAPVERRRGRMSGGAPRPAPPSAPVAGSGWTILGPVDSIAGIRAVPEGKRPEPVKGWSRGGAAVLEADGQTIVLTPMGAWTVPEGATPMAVQLLPTGKLYGALGSALVVCDATCRTLDPGDERAILSVVPRTQTDVILGYGDGKKDAAMYRMPATGGTVTPPHPLEAELEARLEATPEP